MNNSKKNTKFANYPVATSTEAHKSVSGKPPVSLVPMDIITAIAKVREYGVQRYGEEGASGWDKVHPREYRNALGRHFISYMNNPEGVDAESGLSHLWHLATNVAFLISLAIHGGNNDGQ